MSEIKTVRIMEKISGANDVIAAENQERLQQADVGMLNLMSSPGAGKTTLLERTFEQLAGKSIRAAVIEGDVETSHDAERLQRFGIPLVQINAPTCYLSAPMISRALDQLDLAQLDLIFIENIGNLICPAGAKTGEDAKVMLLSATEGHEKPLKYPRMFVECQALIINKIDLIPYTNFDLQQAEANARKINPALKIFRVSSTTGEGIEDWVEYLTTVL